jgi:hypothetical protein
MNRYNLRPAIGSGLLDLIDGIDDGVHALLEDRLGIIEALVAEERTDHLQLTFAQKLLVDHRDGRSHAQQHGLLLQFEV